MKRRFLMTLLVGVAFCGAADRCAAARVPFKMIDGKPVVRGQLVYEGRPLAANVVVDLGSAHPMLLHSNSAEALQYTGEGTFTFSMRGFKLTDLPVYATGLEPLEEMTMLFAAELDEIPVVAIMGLRAFNDLTVTLNIAEEYLEITSAADPIGESTVAVEGVAVPYTPTSNSYWLTTVAEDGTELHTRFSTGQYDTLIDEVTTDLLMAPAGELDHLMLGSINVAKYVALRPEDLSEVLRDDPLDVFMGTNLLEHFVVTIDQTNHRMIFREVKPPAFPTAERDFFIARYEEDADGVAEFVRAHPESRLAYEATGVLIYLRLQEYPPQIEPVVEAMRMQTEVTPLYRRSQNMLNLLEVLGEAERDDRFEIMHAALDIALEYASDDLNAVAAYHVHARKGKLIMEQGDLKTARRHLLSAAFGLPHDPYVNLYLGQLYERMGKLERAWSRFIQATLTDDAPPQALRGLNRLQQDREFRQRFSMADAQELLEGRVLEFNPPQRYGDDAEAGHPVPLVELFACVDQPENMAAQLAAGALDDYFEARDDTVIIVHHLSLAAPDALTCAAAEQRAAALQVTATPAFTIAGGAPQVLGGGETEIDGVFKRLTDMTVTDAPAERWQIDGQWTVQDGRLSGAVTLDGPAAEGVECHLLLCERAILAPGGDGLLMRRNVVRANLGEQVLSQAAGERRVDFGAEIAELEAGLAERLNQIEDEGNISFYLTPTLIDPGQARVVVFIQQGAGPVLAAKELSLTR